MKTTGKKKKVADFATLQEKLQGLENEEFGHAAEGNAATWRDQLIDAVHTFGLQREQLGILIADGEKYFKKTRVWLLVKKATARALGYKSRRSIDTLIDDAKRTQGLRKISPHRYEALERWGVIAAETRWAPFVKKLAEKVPADETEQGAQSKVEKKYHAFLRWKRMNSKRKKTSSALPIEKLNGKIEELLAKLFGQMRDKDLDAALEHIVDRAKQLAKQSAESPVQEDSSVPRDPGPVLVARPKAHKQQPATPAKPTSLAAEGQAETVLHPWGDGYLDLSVAGSIDRIRRNKGAKRIFVRDTPDLFEEKISPYLRKCLFKLFENDSRHTFQLLTTDIEQMSARLHEEKLIATGWRNNVWMGVTITSSNEFDRIEALGRLEIPNKWIALLPFYSSESPLEDAFPDLEKRLKSSAVKWVVFGGVSASEWTTTEKDERFIVHASHQADCKVFCTTLQTMEDFLAGEISHARLTEHIPLSWYGRETSEIRSIRELPDAFKPAVVKLSA